MNQNSIYSVVLFILHFEISDVLGVVQLRGAGASFPAEVYKNWMPLYKAYRQQHKNINMTYSAVGSGAGKRRIQENINIEYGGSDAVLTDTEQADYPDLMLIPSMAGAVVMAYNIPSLSQKLRLTREQVVGIYNGTYRYWNESTFSDSNPNSTFPNARIIVISRADKSGTTFAFTTALSYFSDEWRQTYGVFSKGYDYSTDKPYYWKDGVVTYFGEQNRGCSGLILSFKNSVGYLSVADALNAGIIFSSIRNKAGYYVDATVPAIQSAMDYYHGSNSGLVFDISDSLNPHSYAMASFTYFVVYKSTMKNCESAKELVRYIDWVLKTEEPRRLCQQLGFAPLSLQMGNRVRTNVLKQMLCLRVNVWNMIQADIVLENEVEKPWLVPVAVTIPIVSCILFSMLGYIIYQQLKFQQRINQNEWNIKIEDILFYYDGKLHGQNGSSRHTSTLLGNDIDDFAQRSSIKEVLQWPGKWKGHNVGLRLLEIHHFNTITRDMKRVMLSMKENIIHTNILRFYGLTQLDEGRYIIGDYCSKGCLTTILNDWKYNLTEDMKVSLVTDIANGMAFLHSQGIIHGDFRSSVCLVDFRWTIKISDWEIFKLLIVQNPDSKPLQMLRTNSADQHKQSLSIRNFWTAPELIRSNFLMPPNYNTDVYSYSIIVQEIFSRQVPYSEHSDLLMPSEVLDAIVINGLRPEYTEDTPISMRQIMEIAWSENATSRPTFEQIFKMIRLAYPSRKSMLDSMIDAMEEYTENLEEQIQEKSSEIESSKRKNENILSGSLPFKIAERVSNGEDAIVKKYSNIAVVILKVIGLDSVINSISKDDVYQILRRIVMDVDGICAKYDAYREEFSASEMSFTLILGAETSDLLLPEQIGHLCLDLLHAVKEVNLPTGPFSINCTESKIAATTGNAIAGVVGNKIPMYVVLGNVKDMAKELVKKCLSSHVLILEPLAKKLQEYGFICKTSNLLINEEYETCWLTGRTENASRVTRSVKESETKLRALEDNAEEQEKKSNKQNDQNSKPKLRIFIEKAIENRKKMLEQSSASQSDKKLGFKIRYNDDFSPISSSKKKMANDVFIKPGPSRVAPM